MVSFETVDVLAVVKNQLVIRGLEHTLAMTNAVTYEELIRILGPDPRKLRVFSGNIDPLLVIDPRYRNRLGPFVKCAYNCELMQPPISRDPDTGPRDIWYWAHPNPDTSKLTFSTKQSNLRKEGYVLWDHKRLAGQLASPQNHSEGDDSPSGSEADLPDVFRKYVTNLGQQHAMDYEEVSALIERNIRQWPGCPIKTRLIEAY